MWAKDGTTKERSGRALVKTTTQTVCVIGSPETIRTTSGGLRQSPCDERDRAGATSSQVASRGSGRSRSAAVGAAASSTPYKEIIGAGVQRDPAVPGFVPLHLKPQGIFSAPPPPARPRPVAEARMTGVAKAFSPDPVEPDVGRPHRAKRNDCISKPSLNGIFTAAEEAAKPPRPLHARKRVDVRGSNIFGSDSEAPATPSPRSTASSGSFRSMHRQGSGGISDCLRPELAGSAPSAFGRRFARTAAPETPVKSSGERPAAASGPATAQPPRTGRAPPGGASSFVFG